MQLPLRNFNQLVSDQAAALQSANPDFTDLSPGSPLLALIEANAGMGLFFQYLISLALGNTRMQTSQGGDLDTWGEQFLFGRYPAVASTGIVTCTRATALNACVVPVNTLFRTADGSLTFQVVADTTNEAYDPVLSRYEYPAGLHQFPVLVQCVTAGAAGNVVSNSITKIASSLAGVSSVTNTAPFINGSDAESDASFRTRFQFYINSRDKGTYVAYENAIVNSQPGLTYTILENVDADLVTPLSGHVRIYFDDGTGAPPDGLVALVQQNCEAVRPIGVSMSVQPATPVPVSIFLSTTFKSSYNKTALLGNLAVALENYINGLAVGETLVYTRLYQVIYDNAGPGLIEATNLLVNNVAADLQIKPSQVARFLPASLNGNTVPASTMTID